MHSLWFLMTYLLDEDMLFGYLYGNCGKDWHSIPFFWAFLRFKLCRQQQIFWISLSGRSPEMVELPGKGVRVSQEQFLCLSGRFSLGISCVLENPALPDVLGSKYWYWHCLAVTSCLELLTILHVQWYFSLWLLSVEHPALSPSENTQLPPQKVTLFKTGGKKLRNYLHFHTNRNALILFFRIMRCPESKNMFLFWCYWDLCLKSTVLTAASHRSLYKYLHCFCHICGTNIFKLKRLELILYPGSFTCYPLAFYL